MNEPWAGKSDELLRAFLQATDEAESQSLMTCLINEHADPLIKEIIAFKMRASFEGANDVQESEDVYNNVLMSLLKRLRLARQQPENHTINNFRGYVATITYNACANLLREKYPQRHILKNRLRYFLTHEAGFALWEGQPREWLCGFDGWQSTGRPPVGAAQLHSLRDSLAKTLSSSFVVEDLQRGKLKELLTAIFNRLLQAVEIDELVKLVAGVCGLRDTPASLDSHEARSASLSEVLPDSRADIEAEFERRVYLEKLWAEICQLPERQRSALLLNLKDAQGGCGMALFPLTGVADFQQLAQALGLSAEELARLWSDLPMEDLTIAAALGITRQQVINLRKSARERLGRRLKDY
jgi:DNA-directed RNA polymerase specialized sigma24 family protein